MKALLSIKALSNEPNLMELRETNINCYTNLSQCYSLQKNYNKALEYVGEALKIDKKHDKGQLL